MLVDTHCHLDEHAFDPDRAEVIQRALDAGVMKMITIGVDVASSRRAIMLAEQHAAVYAAVGVHPNDCVDFDADTLHEIRSLAQHPKVVAIGEIGLDYYWQKVDHATQARAFHAQLVLASELHKPVIVHSREAAADVLAILEQHAGRDSSLTTRGVLHSYFDDLAVIHRAAVINFYFGVTGPITFKKSDRERMIVRQAPLDRMVVETDAPFLTPVPRRGQRNEPAYVRQVAEVVAEARGLALEEVARQTTLNAQALFGW